MSICTCPYAYIISNLPVEAIDDEEEREQEYSGDFEDSEELEDEVVECERLIAQAKQLMATVREHYLPSEASLVALTATSKAKTFAPNPKEQSKPEKKRGTDWSFIWIIILGILIASAIMS